MATISAITSSSGFVNVFVNDSSSFSGAIEASFAGLTLSGSLAALLNGTTRVINSVGSGFVQFYIPGAPAFPSGSGSDAEIGTLTPVSNTQTVFLGFEDPAGNPIANGWVDIWLTYDISTAVTNGTQVAAGRKITVDLDASGTCIVTLYINSLLQPAGSQYNARCYTAKGQPCWDGLFSVTATGENFLLQEDGQSGFLLEDGSGMILLES